MHFSDLEIAQVWTSNLGRFEVGKVDFGKLGIDGPGNSRNGRPGRQGYSCPVGGNRATRDPGNHGFPGPGKSGNRGFPTHPSDPSDPLQNASFPVWGQTSATQRGPGIVKKANSISRLKMPLKQLFFDFSGIPGNRGTLTFRGFPGVGRARPTPRFGRVGRVGRARPTRPNRRFGRSSKPSVWTTVGGGETRVSRPVRTRVWRSPEHGSGDLKLARFPTRKSQLFRVGKRSLFDLEKCPNFATFSTRKVSTFEVPEPQVWTIQKKWPYFQPRKVTIKVATFLVTFLDVKNELKVARLTTPDGSVLIYILLINLSTFRPPGLDGSDGSDGPVRPVQTDGLDGRPNRRFGRRSGGGNQGFPTRPDPGLEVSGTRFRRPPNLLIFRPGKVNFSGSENGHFFDLEKCPNFDTFPTRKVSTFEVPEPQVWTIQKEVALFPATKSDHKSGRFFGDFFGR